MPNLIKNILDSNQLLLCLFAVAMLVSNTVQSQQDAQYTQYMYNTVTDEFVSDNRICVRSEYQFKI